MRDGVAGTTKDVPNASSGSKPPGAKCAQPTSSEPKSTHNGRWLMMMTVC